MKRTLTSAAVLAIIAAAALIFLTPATAKSDAEPGPSLEQQQEAHASLLADAIEDAEGKCAPGLSGERGCFQYLPSTWSAYSKDVTGKVVPQTGENERYVTEGKILEWLKEGVSDRGIFLTWNQGSATGWGPGTKDCYAGVNSYGVRYDSCAYAARALAYLKSTCQGEAQTCRGGGTNVPPRGGTNVP